MTLDELIQAHPILQNVECGVDVPPGWVALVHDLATKLEAIRGVKIEQLKQKLGGLRCYLVYLGAIHNAEADRLIDEAEDVAGRTCEVCGAEGSTVRSAAGYLTVRCQEHLPG